MKKTLTANIGGLVFHIDEDAYNILLDYLNKVKTHFKNQNGTEDIISDIESRIAEIFQTKTNPSKQVINLDDVYEIIRIMGSPEQFGEGGSTDGASHNETNTQNKKLYRDPDDKIIAGVCSGIAAFFAIEALWVRILFVIFFFAFSSSFWIYIILWVLVPKARNIKEKLEMKGQKINISNIEASLKEDLKDIENHFRNFSNDAQKVYENNKDKTVAPAIRFFVQVLKYFGRTLGVIIGSILVFAGIFLLIGFFSSFFHIYNIPLDATGLKLANISIPVLFDILFPTKLSLLIGILGLLLIIGIPLLMLVYNGFKLIFGFKYTSKFIGFTGFSLWLIGFAFCTVSGIQLYRSFAFKTHHSKKIELKSTDKKMHIELETPSEILLAYESDAFQIGQTNLFSSNKDIILYGKPDITLNQRKDIQEIEILVLSTARGYNKADALKNTKKISYQLIATDSLITLPYYYTLENNKWRQQDLKIIMNFPRNYVLSFSPEALDIIKD